jgi:hypothetical protein
MFKEIKLEQARELSDGVKSATLTSVSGACSGSMLRITPPDKSTCWLTGCSKRPWQPPLHKLFGIEPGPFCLRHMFFK